MIGYFNCQIIKACKTNNLDIFKEIKLGDQNIFFEEIILKYYFRLACYHGSEDIVEFLIEKYSLIKFTLSINIIFKLIYRKKLNILKIIYNKNIFEFQDYKILYYIARNDLEILEWIDGLNIFDLSHNNEFVCLNAAFHEKINILNWLIEKNCNYKINNHYIFKTCCHQKKMKSINYLCNINNFYFYKIKYLSSILEDYKIIPIIKEINLLVYNKKWKEIIDHYQISLLNIQPNIECCISYTKSNFVSNCNHYFNFESLMKWYVRSKKCPLCKNEIKLSNCKVLIDYYKFLQD